MQSSSALCREYSGARTGPTGLSAPGWGASGLYFCQERIIIAVVKELAEGEDGVGKASG